MAIFKGRSTQQRTVRPGVAPDPWVECPVCGTYGRPGEACWGVNHARMVIQARRNAEGWVEVSGTELTELLVGKTRKVSNFDFQDFPDAGSYTGVPFENEGGMFFFRREDIYR